MAAPTFPSTNETTNYARLCRLLIDVSSSVLRETFGKKRPPGNLDNVLSSPPVHSTLQKLRRKKVLNSLQWDKLYPAIKSSVSSKHFDITLLTVLLRSICGLHPPATGWDNIPAVADTTLEADIVRIKYYRNTVYGHATKASVDDATFNQCWKEIQDALVRLGGVEYQEAIGDLKNQCMDPVSEEHYKELLKQCVHEETRINERLHELEENLGRKLDDLKETVTKHEKKTGVKGIAQRASVDSDKENYQDPSEQSVRDDISITGKIDEIEENLVRKLDDFKETMVNAEKTTGVQGNLEPICNPLTMELKETSPATDLKCRSSIWRRGLAIVSSATQRLKKQVLSRSSPRSAENSAEVIQRNQEIATHLASAEKKINRTQPDHYADAWSYAEKVTNRLKRENVFPVEGNSKVIDKVVLELERAINYHQSDHIADAGNSLESLFQILARIQPQDLEVPNEYDWPWLVLARGKELFLEDGVSCSIKHGTLLLDSSVGGQKYLQEKSTSSPIKHETSFLDPSHRNNSMSCLIKHGTSLSDSRIHVDQFYSSVLNVMGAFALLISEFGIAKKTFELLFALHQRLAATRSPLQDLGAAYNNKGCISLIMGDFCQADDKFKNSLKHFKSRKLGQPDILSMDTKRIAVNSNISRLHLVSRNFYEALEQQEQLVNDCKGREIKEIPFQTVFTMMNNQAVLHTSLGNFNIAEHNLRWLIDYCNKLERGDCDRVLNFVKLHLSEVLLLHGNSKEAEEEFSLERLSSISFEDLVDMFGALYMNVGIEAFEKLVEVYVRRGKIKIALELLNKIVKIIKKVFGPDHLNVASLLYKHGTILSLIGEVSSAVQKFKLSADILQKIFGLRNPLLLKCYMALGELSSRLNHTEKSHLYFQRATESIEVLYQVSFVRELSRTYMEITKPPRKLRSSVMFEDRIEGLVAEHGQALAILLLQDNNSHLRRCRTNGEHLLATYRMGSQCSDSMVLLSLKYTRDLLQTGQKLLREGMRKEAAAFFKQAREHCELLHLIQGHPNVDLARLYNVLIKKHSEALEDDRDLNNFLKELTKDAKEREKESSTGVAATMESDYQFNLKLSLIFLLMWSIELKMIDTTFAIYDLYSKLSQNDNEFLFLLNDGVQVYTSKTLITCNGETAVQDILISSGIGLNESDEECPPLEEQLFKSLCYKKNAPKNAFLVTTSSPVSLDIDDLHSIEKKTSLAVQECFQMKCFETKTKGSTTQVVVDLTSTMSTCGYCDILSTGRRIELLPLCLSDDLNAGVFHKDAIFEINNAMCQRITCVTFEDEQTSCFIFNKTALGLLQQGNSTKVSTMALPSHSLSLTVIHPVKARLTLSRSEKLITQTILSVTTETTVFGLESWDGPQQALLIEPSEKSCPHSVSDAFSLPGIDQMVEKYQVPCKKRIYSKGSFDNSVAHCRSNASPMREWQPNEISSDVYSREGKGMISELQDSYEIPRNSLKESVLECRETVREISRLVHGETVQSDNDISLADLTEAPLLGGLLLCAATTSQSQVDQGNISSTFQQSTPNREFDVESHYPTSNAPGCISIEANPFAHEKESMLREEDDEFLMGKRLFNDDRHSFMADLRESLKKKELNFKECASINFLNGSMNGPNLKEESGRGSLYNPSRSIGLTHTDGQISFKPQARIAHCHETTSRSLYLGGDVVADGEGREVPLQVDNDHVNGPILAQGSPREIQVIHGSKTFKVQSQECVAKSDESKSFKTRNAIEDSGYPPTGHGGARPKQRSVDNVQNLRTKSSVNDLMPANHYDQRREPGLDPIFVVRHINDGNRLNWFSNGGNYNQAALEAAQRYDYDQCYFSSKARENYLNGGKQKLWGKECPQLFYTCSGSGTYLSPKGILAPRNSSIRQTSPLNENESWYFSPPVFNGDSVSLQSQNFVDRGSERDSTESIDPVDSRLKALFNSSESRGAYNDMESMVYEYCSSIENVDCIPVKSQSQSPTISEDQQSSTEHSSPSLLGSLQQVMAKTVNLIASSTTAAKEPQDDLKSFEKIGIQEKAREREPSVIARIDESRDRDESTQANEPTPETERQSIATPVQESPRPVCSHYQRRCLVRFPCCGTLYPCHRCHSESDCSEDQARAINATHIRCTICYHEQAIDRESQKCGGCKSTMSEYFCGICKHFTSVDKNPFHCEKCSISRIHRDRSFHCDVCNVCLDKRLQGKHKCRPECCICLEEAFSGCQILPCSHKDHKD